MYILINEDSRPFAIITKPLRELIVKAIEEEFSIKDVKLDNFREPDWGETNEFNVEARDLDEEDEIGYTLEITKLVAY